MPEDPKIDDMIKEVGEGAPAVQVELPAESGDNP